MSRLAPLDLCDEAAIGWLVDLGSGAASADERQAFERWLDADPLHRSAWQRLAGALDHTFGGAAGPLDPVAAPADRPRPPSRTVLTVLEHAARQGARRRSLLRGALAVAGVGVSSAWIGREAGVLPDVVADLSTGTGERRRFTLPDGSSLLLDARSSADVQFSSERRQVRLRQGQLIAEVRSGSAVPFVVRSAHGTVQALGTRFLVRRDEARSFVQVLANRVDIAIARAGPTRTLGAGDTAWFDATHIEETPPAAVAGDASAWSHGMLEAQDLPVGQIVQALRPYRNGLLRISAEAAQLRASGNYPPDDTDAVLTALAETLPIDVHRHRGGWLVRIERRA